MASLVITALIGVAVFIVGDLGDGFGTQYRLLVTTVAVAALSLTGLASAALYDRGKWLPLSFTGIADSVLAFVLAIPGLLGSISVPMLRKATVSRLLVLSSRNQHNVRSSVVGSPSFQYWKDSGGTVPTSRDQNPLSPLPEKEGGYRGMVRWMADNECVPNAGQTL